MDRLNTGLVIARYKENISWMHKINNFNEIFIYNKFKNYTDENEDLKTTSPSAHLKIVHQNGIIKKKTKKYRVPNVGRESHTYLYHIVHNYDNLNDYTLFCQGNPLDHSNNLIELCNVQINYMLDKVDQENIYFLGNTGYEGVNGIYAPKWNLASIPIYYFFDLLFGERLDVYDILKFYFGGQFVTSKKIIHSRPLSFYKFLLKLVSYDTNPIEAYILERFWQFIFDPSIEISDKYLLFEPNN